MSRSRNPIRNMLNANLRAARLGQPLPYRFTRAPILDERDDLPTPDVIAQANAEFTAWSDSIPEIPDEPMDDMQYQRRP